MSTRPLIAIPMGDPAGIGPEIVLKAIADEETRRVARCIVVGSRKVLERAMSYPDIPRLEIMTVDTPEEGRYAPGIKALLTREKPKIFISGHSHILRVMPDAELDLLHINPGAAGTQGWQKVRTLVRLTLDAGIPKELEVVHLSKPRNF